ncbi:hypothetical protein A2631_01785 [Candidatus Daviesbacteria bacterium RIFCSPHIGHO2_01_FULL_44_29]|uniref:Uncharacterized protein n=1 Tax=Candidatus Daviesbacteria bacterium RIFCSPHIGHO2_02_FULL_43_12 TaxID=1797776 RepID=A0A1F5KKI7_9BACT|nr:MAG: hypothetical protein A2631_01785 [Candidatus Daviesbacteria bacterium RIFCSPHIGHO2_01_FULL_44_29]OGE39025.1 MAG: hypothetical protein A3E86_00295 [Candidatus Daviesbacteria bacterium RIFCSPHIGHO2_12_FULL_47_45]OGE41131.1 MAG: hypothetical protein A3D25_01180 [Candidatus Daviesbacteria bacterium RIFCSPHIGHO2_02_FULL_43_12]OGE69330.1 MAG: hypothetical protein A3B55_02920 [Candidatus Daviesbacteria bacterium RIFCSPLOWO2_01_FULL_43_15]
MAIVMIEYLEGIPLEAFESGNLDMQQMIDMGLLEAKLFGMGKKDNILPRGAQRFMPGGIVPMLVNSDGTALISLQGELSTGEGVSNVPRVETTLRRDASPRVFTEGGNQSGYQIISLPQTVSFLPFIACDRRAGRLEALCFGMLSHRPGASPVQDRALRSAQGMNRALGVE